MPTPIDSADALDAADPLRQWRSRFHIPCTASGAEEAYFLGNSLGLQPDTVQSYVDGELERWRTMAARGHFDGPFPWMPYHEFLTAPMAALVGAEADEVVVMNSLTTNLHLMLATFFQPQGRRCKILLEEHAFPSDQYAVATHLRHRRLSPDEALVRVRPDGALFNMQSICEQMRAAADQLALVLLPGVHYYSGQRFDIARITACARELEIPIGWDLAHAVGNVELQLHRWNADFAVWCCYKYLNSGPGAPGGCFVHRRHATHTDLNRLAGWWGHDKSTRFLMPSQFQPIPTAEGWQLSNPPILAMAAVRASLDLFLEAGGMPPLLEKSRALTGYLERRLRDRLGDAVTLVTPCDPDQRGCQLSLQWNGATDGKRVRGALEQHGVMTDWREPNVIRAAPVPLYSRYADCERLVDVLAELV